MWERSGEAAGEENMSVPATLQRVHRATCGHALFCILLPEQSDMVSLPQWPNYSKYNLDDLPLHSQTTGTVLKDHAMSDYDVFLNRYSLYEGGRTKNDMDCQVVSS